MPIPQTREELTDQIEAAWSKLDAEVLLLTENDADTVVVEDWTANQVLAVRASWSEQIVEWAGTWPLSRWFSINTARQYVTARIFIRRALRS